MSRPMTAVLPRVFDFWPDDLGDLSPTQVQKLYEEGKAGAWQDDAAEETFASFIANSGGIVNGDGAMLEPTFANAGAGKLSIPYKFVEKFYPGAFPGAAQQRGDCVSHGTKNAALITLCCDIETAKPDEVTGKVEGAPEVSSVGIQQGVLSSEAIYWYRGYSGDGWSALSSTKVAIEKSALWLRMNYPDLNVDLTKYSGSLAGKYGRSAPPEEFTRQGQLHLLRTATRLNGQDQIRDFSANGYGIVHDGGEGFSNQRDENGVSRRSGRWSHSMVCGGYDDRDIIKQKYGEALVLIGNSWAKWNTGGRLILGTNIEIPEGWFWAKWSEVKSRTWIALSGANGWPAKKLPAFDLVVG